METHFNVQRRLYDYQFSLTTTPLEFEQAHQALCRLYNTTAHQGLLKDHFAPPIPLVVLGEAKGRPVRPEELWTGSFRGRSFPRPRIAMAVSPCRATISMWNKAYLTPKCCCGSMASNCGQCSIM